MNVIIGIGIVAIAAWLLLKQYDMRMVLIAAGLLMAGIALDPLTALDEFARKMVTDSLIQAICSVLGFAFVMRHTGCEERLIQLTAPRLQRLGSLLVPMATLLTFAINAVLLSAANTTAVAGVILIPLLRAAGIHSAMAASAVLAGTFGSMLNPTLAINSFVAKTAGASPLTVVAVNRLPVIIALGIGALTLCVLAFRLKEYHGFKKENDAPQPPQDLKKNLSAIIPLVPLTILLLGASGLVPHLRMGVAPAMLVGTLMGVILSDSGPSSVTQCFFEGMGTAYGRIMGVIIAVGVFVRGMKSLGLVSLWITWLTTTPEIARIGGGLGPFLLGIVTGSGDAAAFAFNEAVAPHAVRFGMETVNMGSMAAIAGALGRTLSPLSGAAIICSALAEVNPMELTKRNAPGLCAALLVICLLL